MLPVDITLDVMLAVMLHVTLCTLELDDFNVKIDRVPLLDCTVIKHLFAQLVVSVGRRMSFRRRVRFQ